MHFQLPFHLGKGKATSPITNSMGIDVFGYPIPYKTDQNWGELPFLHYNLIKTFLPQKAQMTPWILQQCRPTRFFESLIELKNLKKKRWNLKPQKNLSPSELLYKFQMAAISSTRSKRKWLNLRIRFEKERISRWVLPVRTDYISPAREGKIARPRDMEIVRVTLFGCLSSGDLVHEMRLLLL